MTGADAGRCPERATGTEAAFVLIGEDEPDNQVVLQTVVESLIGLRAEVVADGLALLALVERERPCVILLDLMMPVLDGWQFVDRLRSMPDWRDVPVVVMSATHALHESAERLHAMGVRAVLAKPFDVDALIAIVQRYAPLAA
jgi:CheY-like chemotaxis protein